MPLAVARIFRISHFTHHEGPPKKRKRKQARKKESGEKRPTDFPSFFFLGAPFKRYARRLWTCHRRWAPAAGCGVFLCELVPSGDPFICCLCETFFLADIFYLTDIFFISSEKQIKFVASTATAAVQSKSNSHVSVYY